MPANCTACVRQTIFRSVTLRIQCSRLDSPKRLSGSESKVSYVRCGYCSPDILTLVEPNFCLLSFIWFVYYRL